jgi:molybdate transport system substrate-binding protein
MRKATHTLMAIGTFLLLESATAKAAEIRVLAPTTIRAVINALNPQFERTTGHKILVEYDVAPVVKRQIEGGKEFDLVIVTRPLMDGLVKQGRVRAETRSDIGRAGAGVAVRAGAAKPDVGSADTLRLAFLNAKSIAYAAEGTTGVYFLGLLDRLGISVETKPKLKPMGGGAVVAPVISGEAEIAVVTIPLILEEHRVDLAGPIPSELQNYIVFTAAVGSSAKQAEAARGFVALLTAPTTLPILKANGFEPANP